MKEVAELRQTLPVRNCCEALGLPRGSYYRAMGDPSAPRRAGHQANHPRALTPEERAAVLSRLHEPRFVNRSPAAVYACLLDQQEYLCSVRTMYRILAENQEVRERRRQLRHPRYTKPELFATAPNQVWTWDISKLRGPVKWVYDYLYVILDLFSRYVVTWMLAHRESGTNARALFERACQEQEIEPGSLVTHADRGSAATAKTLAGLLADLGVERSYCRPHVSNDNPYSEAQFKTMKYAPGYPDRFGGYEDARSWCRHFFPWYNFEHRHSGVAYLTPAMVHYGQAEVVLGARRRALAQAYARHPERFMRGVPQPQPLPPAVWINPPEDRSRVELSSAEVRVYG